MVLRILEEKIAGFEEFLRTRAAFADEPLLFYEHLHHFQTNWHSPKATFSETIQNSFYNSQSRRFWHGPVQVLTAFAAFNQEYTELMFRDLFNESKDLSGRIERFKFYSDTLLAELLAENPKFQTDHLQNTEIIYFYLAMRYPEYFAVYRHEDFVKTLQLLGARDVPVVFDPERYYKSSKIFNKYLTDNSLIDKHIARLLKGSLSFEMENMLRVTYFCWYCANHP